MFFRLLVTLTLVFPVIASAHSQVVYMHEAEGQKQIYLYDERTHESRQITSGGLWHLYPDISADGKMIAYVAGPDESHLEVYTKNLDSGQTELWSFAQKGMYLHPELSFDGKRLAVSGPFAENGLSQIAIVDLQAARDAKKGDQRLINGEKVFVYRVQPTLIANSVPSYFPTFNSDATFVYFQQSVSKTQKNIMRYEISSKTLKAIDTGFQISMSPALSFDDEYLAFTAFRDGNWDVYIKDLSRAPNESAKRITYDLAQDFAPTFLPNGDLVYANNKLGRFQIYKISHENLRRENTDESSLLYIESPADLYAPSSSGNLDYTQALLTDMPSPARSSFGAVESNGKIYVVGGHGGREHTYPPESFMNDVSVFDLKTNKWSKLAPRTIAAHGFGLASYGNGIFAFGGFAYDEHNSPSWKSVDAVERYDIASNTWTTVARLPRARSSNVVAQVGKKVYLIGGWDSTPRFPGDYDGTFHREIDVFDLETFETTTLNTTLPNPLRRAFTGVVRGDKIYLLGGLGRGSSHFELLDNVTSFDTKTLTWQECAKLPFATFAPGAGVVGDKIFVFGGMFKTGLQDYNYVNHIFELDLGQSEMKWQHTGRYLSETKGFPQVISRPSQDGLVVLGGHHYWNDGTDSPVLTVEQFLQQ